MKPKNLKGFVEVTKGVYVSKYKAGEPILKIESK